MQQPRNALIGERVRFYRTARDMTMSDLAARLENPITQQQLARYETGISRWPADLLVDIAVIFKLDIRLLTGLEDGKHEGKEDDEWDAEKYKSILLTMPIAARKVVYGIIEDLRKLNKIPQQG